MSIRLLLDENLSPRLKTALLLRFPEMDVLRVGDEGTPPYGTSDPDILLYTEQAQRLLVTDNRTSMPGHITHHLTAGRHHWGVLYISRACHLPRYSMNCALFGEQARQMNGWITPIGYHKHGGVSTLKTSIDVGVGCIKCTGLLPVRAGVGCIGCTGLLPTGGCIGVGCIGCTGLLPLTHGQPVEVCYTALENRLQAGQ